MADSASIQLATLTEEIKRLQKTQAELIDRLDHHNLADPINRRSTVTPTRQIGLGTDNESDTESPKFGSSPGNKRLSTSYTSKNTLPPHGSPTAPTLAPAALYNHRIILTTYPGQVGVNPTPMTWGSSDPAVRGPIIASRQPASIKLRNAVGAHGGKNYMNFNTKVRTRFIVLWRLLCDSLMLLTVPTYSTPSLFMLLVLILAGVIHTRLCPWIHLVRMSLGTIKRS